MDLTVQLAWKVHLKCLITLFSEMYVSVEVKIFWNQVGSIPSWSIKCLIVISVTLMHFEICLLGCTRPPLSFMTIREDDSRKPVLVYTMSSMQSEHFKRQKILLSTELKVYCWCVSNLANSDTSTTKKHLTHTKQQMATTNFVAIGVTFSPKRN